MSHGRSMSLLVLAGALWGTGGLAGALLQASADLHPIAVAAYRLLIGGGLATLVLAGRLARLPRTAAVARRLLAVGALMGLFQAGYFGAVLLTSVSLATLIAIGSAPVFVAVGAAALDRRRPGGRTLVSIALAVAGLALLAGTPTAAGAWRLAGGVALALLSGAGFAALTLVNRRPAAGLDSGVTTGLGLLVGGVMLLPVALPLGMGAPATAEVLLTAAFLGAVPTAAAYGAYFAGLRGAHPVAAALAAMLEPLTATALSAVVLGDRLGPAGVVGAVLLAAALAVDYLRGPQRRIQLREAQSSSSSSLGAGRVGAGRGDRAGGAPSSSAEPKDR